MLEDCTRVIYGRPSGICYSNEMPFIRALEAQRKAYVRPESNPVRYLPSKMKRTNPYSTREQRLAKIAANPKSLAYRQQRQMVLYQNPITQQSIRTGGWANPSRGGELKFTDISNTLIPVFATAAFNGPILLNGLVPGSGADQRIGRKVTIKSLLLKYSFNLGATSTGGSPCRILVVYDKQANAVAPNITDVLLADAFNSPNNLSNRDRFVTLVDQITDNISVQWNFSIGGSIFKKLNLETMFNAGTAGSIGDITSGSILIFAAQAGNIGTASPGLIFRSRIRYQD